MMKKKYFKRQSNAFNLNFAQLNEKWLRLKNNRLLAHQFEIKQKRQRKKWTIQMEAEKKRKNNVGENESAVAVNCQRWDLIHYHSETMPIWCNSMCICAQTKWLEFQFYFSELIPFINLYIYNTSRHRFGAAGVHGWC